MPDGMKSRTSSGATLKQQLDVPMEEIPRRTTTPENARRSSKLSKQESLAEDENDIIASISAQGTKSRSISGGGMQSPPSSSMMGGHAKRRASVMMSNMYPGIMIKAAEAAAEAAVEARRPSVAPAGRRHEAHGGRRSSMAYGAFHRNKFGPSSPEEPSRYNRRKSVAFELDRDRNVRGQRASSGEERFGRRASFAVDKLPSRRSASVTAGTALKKDVPGEERFGNRPSIFEAEEGASRRDSIIPEGLQSRRSSTFGGIPSKRASVVIGNLYEHRSKTPMDNIYDWAMVTNLHGFYYVFEKGVHYLSNVFWAVSFLGLVALALHMINKSYADWCEQPVLTIARTTTLPIEKVDFPVITICGLGTMKGAMETAFLNQFARHLEKKGIPVDISNPAATHDLLSKFGDDFIHEQYPGAAYSPVEMAALMASHNPTDLIRAQITSANEEETVCSDQVYDIEGNRESENQFYDLCSSSMYDEVTKACYEFSTNATTYEGALKSCWKKSGYLFYPRSDEQFSGLTRLIDEGPLEILKQGQDFWIDLTRNSDGTYELLDGRLIDNSTFHHLKLKDAIHDSSNKCFVIHYDERNRVFIGQPESCGKHVSSLCYSVSTDRPVCSSSNATQSSENRNVSSDSLQKTIASNTMNEAMIVKKSYINKAFNSLDMSSAYSSLFELLWYSQLPCFDVNGFFDSPHQQSLLKKCQWKGIDIPCSAIFKTVPTDRGVCCSFNAKAADEIFYNSKYDVVVSSLQKHDAENAHIHSTLPEWYTDASEPKSQQGLNKGLLLTLDAHSNLIGSSTVNEDFQGFIAIVNAPNAYPLGALETIRISPGHETLVAMSAVDIMADLEKLNTKDRKCFYPSGSAEDVLMKVHNNYSQTNCILECKIEYALERMVDFGEDPCIPWYFPALTNDVSMCNPWAAVIFRDHLNHVPLDHCTFCLPDCQTTIFTHYVTSAPFRGCDSTNLGISDLCNIDDWSLHDPPIFGKQVLEEYADRQQLLPDYVDNIKTNLRHHSEQSKSFEDSYDAYEEDIAVVHFYFESPTIFQFSRDSSQTWLDLVFESAGLLNLCIGFSLCMGVEILYWMLFRVWHDIRAS